MGGGGATIEPFGGGGGGGASQGALSTPPFELKARLPHPGHPAPPRVSLLQVPQADQSQPQDPHSPTQAADDAYRPYAGEVKRLELFGASRMSQGSSIKGTLVLSNYRLFCCGVSIPLGCVLSAKGADRMLTICTKNAQIFRCTLEDAVDNTIVIQKMQVGPAPPSCRGCEALPGGVPAPGHGLTATMTCTWGGGGGMCT